MSLCRNGGRKNNGEYQGVHHVFRKHDYAEGQPIPTMPNIVIHAPELAVFFQEVDEMSCGVEVKKPSNGCMTAFDLAFPVFPRRLVVLTFELVDAGTTHIVFSGSTKPLMKGFQNMQVYREYFRVDENLSLINSASATMYLGTLHRDCLHSSPCPSCEGDYSKWSQAAGRA